MPVWTMSARPTESTGKPARCLSGGTFSLIYSALNPDKIKNLITLVTPVEFADNDGLLFKWSRDMDVDTMVGIFWWTGAW